MPSVTVYKLFIRKKLKKIEGALSFNDRLHVEYFQIIGHMIFFHDCNITLNCIQERIINYIDCPFQIFNITLQFNKMTRWAK